jgi:polyhydroxybutyrate depolymerase
MRYLALILLVGCGGSSDAIDTPVEEAGTDTAENVDSAITTEEDTGTLPGVDSTAPPDDTATTTDAPADTTKADAPLADSAPAEVGGDSGVISAGCGKVGAAGVTTGKITVGALTRTYVLSIPAGYTSSKPYPLLFAWHGRTGSGAGFRSGGLSYGGGVEKSSAGKGIFVYPDGLPVSSDPKDTGWIDGDPKGRDFQFFDALLADLTNRFCVDRKRVFSYGHSFGGYMTNHVGCYRSSVIRGIAPVASGGPFGTACDNVPVAAYISNAKDDKVVPYSQGTGSRDRWVKTNMCDITKTTALTPAGCVAYGGCAVGDPVTFCGTETGGHGFPTYLYDGIWNFFTALP